MVLINTSVGILGGKKNKIELPHVSVTVGTEDGSYRSLLVKYKRGIEFSVSCSI